MLCITLQSEYIQKLLMIEFLVCGFVTKDCKYCEAICNSGFAIVI